MNSLPDPCFNPHSGERLCRSSLISKSYISDGKWTELRLTRVRRQWAYSDASFHFSLMETHQAALADAVELPVISVCKVRSKKTCFEVY